MNETASYCLVCVAWDGGAASKQLVLVCGIRGVGGGGARVRVRVRGIVGGVFMGRVM